MVKDNIERTRGDIARICAKLGRKPEEVQIVAVTKARTIEEIKQALEAGIQHIGENKVQEALVKRELIIHDFQPLTPKWHFIGHLQTNKVKEAVKIFDLIHSVDSVRLAEEISKEAGGIGKIQDILIEVKTSPETTKFGFSPQEVIVAVQEISGLKNLKIRGLMTIAPVVDDPEKARHYFRMLREIKDTITQTINPKPQDLILSMGMSDDFKVAIEEGANMVRLGRIIFKG